MQKRSLLSRLGLWIPPAVYMLLIFHFSSEPQPLPALTTVIWDKALHLVEYGALGGLFCRAFRGEGFGWAAVFFLSLIATSAYGASDEWHQAFVPLRDSSVRDWLADSIGAAVGVALYGVFRAGARTRQKTERRA
jgi:VanZ family protein